MADRYDRWDDEERRHPYESRSREHDWSYGGRSDRAFFERFLDELRSWFGDENAQRRRIADERDDPRGRGEWGGRDWSRRRGEWAREPIDRSSSGQYDTWTRERDWTREPPWGGQGPGGFGMSGSGPEVGWSGRADSSRYSGTSSARERDWGSGPHYGRGPRNYQRSDERIREDVCERLTQHSYLDPSDVEIIVSNADVTLQGSVNDRWAKRMVEEIAEGVPGVKEVHNQLRVSQGTFGQERASQERSIQEGQGRSTGQPRGNWAA